MHRVAHREYSRTTVEWFGGVAPLRTRPLTARRANCMFYYRRCFGYDCPPEVVSQSSGAGLRCPFVKPSIDAACCCVGAATGVHNQSINQQFEGKQPERPSTKPNQAKSFEQRAGTGPLVPPYSSSSLVFCLALHCTEYGAVVAKRYAAYSFVRTATVTVTVTVTGLGWGNGRQI